MWLWVFSIAYKYGALFHASYHQLKSIQLLWQVSNSRIFINGPPKLILTKFEPAVLYTMKFTLIAAISLFAAVASVQAAPAAEDTTPKAAFGK